MEEFAAAELPGPGSPEVPQPPAVPEALSEKGAADGAEESPVPAGWGSLWEDDTPRAGGVEAAAELPRAGGLPDGTLGFAFRDKLAAPLLLFAARPAVRKWMRTSQWHTCRAETLLHLNTAEENSSTPV